MDSITDDPEEFGEYAEALSSISNEGARNRKLSRIIEESGGSPILVIDFHHNVPGEIVSIRDLDEVIKKEAGVYKIMLFDSDDLGSHIPDISKKLSENLGILGSWTIIFTNAGKYCDLEEFRDFMEGSESVGRIILL